ncbi:MAG: hypothetical protein ACLR2E_23200 [Lachnospiraceae bacterium]
MFTVPFEIDHLAENNDLQKDNCPQSMDLSGNRVLLVEDNAINMEIAMQSWKKKHLDIAVKQKRKRST